MAAAATMLSSVVEHMNKHHGGCMKNAFRYGHQMPYGMTDNRTLCVLYELAYVLPGPILEQGCFVGRSTSAIALAVKHASLANASSNGHAAGEPKEFVTHDLFPASPKSVDAGVWPAREVPYRFSSSPGAPGMYDEWIHDYKEIAHIPKEAFRTWFRDYLDHPGGQLHAVYAHLNRNKLLPYVVITAGERIPSMPYRFIWSDAAHTREEVAKNAPTWLKPCEAQPGSVIVFAFHDVSENPRLIAQVNRVFESKGHSIVPQSGRYNVAIRPIRQAGLYAIEVRCRARGGAA